MKKNVLLPEIALFLSIFLLMVGQGLHGTLVGVRAELEGFPILMTGIIIASYNLGFFAGTLLSIRFLKRVGHIRTFSAFASIVSAAAIAFAVWPNALFWAFLRFIIGFAFANIFLTAETWLNNKVSNDIRGRVLAVYMLVQYVGLVAGYMAMNLDTPQSYNLFVLFSIMVSLSVVPLALTSAPGPSIISRPDKIKTKELLKTSPLATLTCIGCGLCNGAFFGLIPVFAVQTGMNVAQTSWLMTATIVGGMVLQWPAGMLSDTYPRRLVLSGITLFALASTLGLAFSGGNFWLVLLFAGITGGMLLLLYPIAISIVIDKTPAEDIMGTNAQMLMLWSVGSFTGPAIASGLMAPFGPMALMYWVAGILALISVYALWRNRLYKGKVSDQSDFIPLPPQTTSATLELDEHVQDVIDDADGAFVCEPAGIGGGEGK